MILQSQRNGLAGPPRSRSGLRSVRRHWRAIVIHAVLIVISLVTLIPFAWMVDLAITPATGVGRFSVIPHAPTLVYFAQAVEQAAVLRWTLNSTIYAVVSVVVSLLLASMAAYAFAKKRFPGNHVMFWSFIAMLMVPAQLTIVPLYLIIANLNGIDTYWGLILPTIASAQAVFLLRQFILNLPDELFEAAKLDGASEINIFLRIVLPMCTPVLATLAIFIFLFHWNDFLWPLLAAESNDMNTLTVGLATLQAKAPSVGVIMASTILSFIPSLVIFAALQRYIVRGISLTGLSGL